MSLFFPRREPARARPRNSTARRPSKPVRSSTAHSPSLRMPKTRPLKAAAKPQAGKIELYSPKYYAACHGLTHAGVTPLDLVKTRRQVDSKLYTSNFQAWGKIYRGEGLRGIFTGWSRRCSGTRPRAPSSTAGTSTSRRPTPTRSAPRPPSSTGRDSTSPRPRRPSFLADIALCPFEAVKVRMQGSLQSPFRGTFHGISSVTAKEGVAGLYKGIYPLWGRQIPYTMMKFASFETITGVSFTGGYLAGILCAIVSHPADVMVSKLNANREPGEAFGKAMSRIYKDIGFSGLWNGLPVRIVMIGTLTGLQWMIYVSVLNPPFRAITWRDSSDFSRIYFKIFMGFPTTGGPAPAKESK
ncbi:unnamed protein product [Clonostachys rosea f. rosea IK726]|uniref:Uncharacterized protein n=1 Tax=Clonostachys rosea f. rosea IK726 TaxID=1349383 RepID=A0ACA9UMP8_BIOOC|nr:unnamed protein product [Clonostachys rosea f. rosea IK726]